MSSKKFLRNFALALLLGAAALGGAVIFGTPSLVRLWLRWTVRADQIEIAWQRMEAPLFGAVVLHDVTLRSRAGAPSVVALEIGRATLDFRVAAFFDSARGRVLRRLELTDIRGEVQPGPQVNAPAARADLRSLLADDFHVSIANLRVVRGSVRFEIRDAALDASELETGHFSARELVVAMPWLHTALRDLKGAASWQYNRLTLGAISLLPGLDLDAMTLDFAHLSEDRLSIETNLDAFGGKLRANIAKTGSEWDVAGTATQISLAQASDALQFSSRTSGVLHASKFTFRGKLSEIAEATASLWAEADGLTWRDRTADTVMIGASLYHRQIQIDQLYLKQRDNQLTLNGETSLPRKLGEWPDFRGDVAASIRNLGEFARLFGGRAAEFTGAIDVNGSMDERAHRFTGHLEAVGNALVIFGAPFDSLRGKFNLNGAQIDVETFELSHGSDLLKSSGMLELGQPISFAGELSATVADLAPYSILLRQSRLPLDAQGSLQVEVETAAASTAGTQRFHASGRNLKLTSPAWLLPFEGEASGTMSAGKIYFDRLSLANAHAVVDATATIANDYTQLQNLRVALDGKPWVAGEIYLPVGCTVSPFTLPRFQGFQPGANISADFQFLPRDLRDISRAFSSRSDLSGMSEGRVEVYGKTESPELKVAARVRDFSAPDAPHISSNLEITSAASALKFSADLAFAGASASKFGGTVPWKFNADNGAYRMEGEAPFTAEIKLQPNALPPWLAKFISIDPTAFHEPGVSVNFSGSADLADSAISRLTFRPSTPIGAFPPPQIRVQLPCGLRAQFRRPALCQTSNAWSSPSLRGR